MSIILVNPEGLPEVDLYRQLSIATGSKLIFMAGQVSVNVDGAIVGVGDLTAQAEQCYLNVATALAAAGASFDDVAKLTVYLVDWAPDKMGQFVEGVTRASAKLGIASPLPPLTGIGVAALAEPELLIEVEATAVIN
ncbi:RidA family protein [Rhodococcus sp. DMU1]|uniref:RidA family protein n=1 Tax=Rhodococcus sp. DMU1 TaxID=2722825 RepID=UPI00143ED534|nr:RidA family protein [Rhodococcus sp. DMU1]QIX49082.1 RidA family protein [Rhodococcus sp. DMU1]